MSKNRHVSHHPAKPSNRIADEIAPPSGPMHPSISVVVPLFNESATLAPLCERIGAALLGRSFEILLVDDGSRDDSWKTISELAVRNPSLVRGLRHRRNFGKADALATGFAHAAGSTIVTIDADLQDDPAEIPALLAKLDQGYDLVSGWKENRHDPISKTIPSRFFNAAARAISGLKLHDFNCGLKAYRREVVENLALYGELHRFIPILAHSEGFRVAEQSVRHFPRQHGSSKYGWGRFFKGSLDLAAVVLLTRYLKRPGHFFGAIGLVLGFLGGSSLAYLATLKIVLNQNIGARPLLFFGILATLLAAQMITTGFLGEFLLRHRANASSPRLLADRTDRAD